MLEHLVDQSLVQMDDTLAEARFRMLETVRQFARRELERAGEVDALAARHATYFAARARTLWPLFHDGMTELLDRADEELDDLVAMLGYLERNATTEEYGEVAFGVSSRYRYSAPGRRGRSRGCSLLPHRRPSVRRRGAPASPAGHDQHRYGEH